MISFSNINPSVRASKVFVETEGVRRTVGGDNIPPIGLIVGQYDQTLAAGITDDVPVKVTTADQAGTLFGFGSELHRQAMWIFGALGGFYDNMWAVPIAEPGAAVKASGDIVFGAGPATSGGTFRFSIGGDIVNVNVAIDDTITGIGDALVAAITAELGASVTAVNALGTVTVTAKTAGVNGNEISLVLNPSGQTDEDLNPAGVTVTVPGSGGYLTGGVGATDVSGIWANLGSRWYTHISGPYTDATNLASYDAAGDARFDPGTNRFFAAYFGYVKENYAAALAVPATINSKWINPTWEDRSYSPRWEMQAAVMGFSMASMALDPGRPFKTLAVGIPVNPATPNRTYDENDALFRAGMGYFNVDTAGALRIGDLATTYRTAPGGAPTEEWFDTVAIHLRQQKSFNLETLFLGSPYERGIVADDTTITAKDYVIKPAKVITDLFGMIDFWNSEGWTKNPATVKATVAAEINTGNNSRIDAELTDDPAQALRIIAVKYKFLFD